jgi:hypothetical protein
MDTDVVDNTPSDHPYTATTTATDTTPPPSPDQPHDDDGGDHQARQMTQYQVPAPDSPGSQHSTHSVVASMSESPNSHGGRGSSGGRGRGSRHLITQPPEFIVKSPWKDNQTEVAYDDMAVETFEGGKGEDDENEWHDDEPRASGSPATVLDDGDCSVNKIHSISSVRSTATPTTQPQSQQLPWSPESSQPLP